MGGFRLLQRKAYLSVAKAVPSPKSTDTTSAQEGYMAIHIRRRKLIVAVGGAAALPLVAPRAAANPTCRRAPGPGCGRSGIIASRDGIRGDFAAIGLERGSRPAPRISVERGSGRVIAFPERGELLLPAAHSPDRMTRSLSRLRLAELGAQFVAELPNNRTVAQFGLALSRRNQQCELLRDVHALDMKAYPALRYVSDQTISRSYLPGTWSLA